MKKARISFGLGRTLNMGDFESTKIQIGLEVEMEGEVTKDEVEKAYQRIKTFVEKKIKQEEMEWKV